MCSLIVRQYFLQPPSERVLASLSIELLDPRAPEPDRAQLSARRLSAAAAFVRSTNLAFPPPAGPGPNAFGEPLGYSGEAGALGTTDNVYVMGRWRLAADEALVVDTTPVPCRYWSLQVWNHWGQSLTQTITSENYPRLIANSARTVPEPDGTTRIVIANRDGGAANWLDTFGWTSGVLIFRYLYPEARPEKPTCRVVPAVG